MTPENPYSPPTAPTHGAAAQGRPVSPKVFGILSICFGGFGLLLSPFAFLTLDGQEELYERMGYSLTYIRYSQFAGIGFAVWQLITGIGLVRYRSWSRPSFNAYAIVTIVTTIASTVYTLSHVFTAQFDNEIERAGAIGGSFGGLIALIYPILGLVFLNRVAVRNALRADWMGAEAEDL